MVTEEGLNEIVKYAKIIGEFKENQKVINKCREFNFEFTNETILARAYNKFEKTLLNVLDIKFSDLKKMSESDEYTQKILDKKLSELSKDEKRFEKAMKQLGDVIAEMEVKLNGNSEQKSKILDLINATENNYNKTAQRISKLGSFKSTIDRLVKQDVETLSNSLHNKQQLFDFLDGLLKNNFVGFDWGSASDAERLKYINEHSKGLGSSKNIEINRILERYQGAKNSFFRIMHTMDVYKRTQTPENFANSLNGKNAEYIKQILGVADFVKFAKMRPLPSDNIQSFDNAMRFIEETKPEEKVEENNNEEDKRKEDKR
jgi:Rad3-related DNA helicase